MNTSKQEKNFIIGIATFIIVVLGIAIWGIPQYRIYSQNLKGQANLRQQEWEKQIAIEGSQSFERISNFESRSRSRTS